MSHFHTLKMSVNQSFSNVFRGYRNRILVSYLKLPTIFINEEFEQKVIDKSPLLHCSQSFGQFKTLNFNVQSPSVQCPESSVQSSASRVQRQSSASKVQRPVSSVHSPASNTCSRIQEFQYAFFFLDTVQTQSPESVL